MPPGCRAVVLAIILVASFAWAAPDDTRTGAPASVRLSWVRSENASGCISRPALEREVALRLGRDPFAGEARQWVEGSVRVEGGEFRVELFERDAEGNTLGSRTLHEVAGDCRKLDEAVTLAVALIIDPTVKLEPRAEAAPVEVESPVPTTAPTRAPPPAPTTAPTRAASPEAAQTPPAASRAFAPGGRAPVGAPPVPPDGSETSGHPFLPALVVSPVAIWGVLPGISYGLEATTEAFLLRSQLLSVRLGMLHLPEKRVTESTGDFGFGLTAVGLGLCAAAPGGPVAWFGCATVQGGTVHAVVYDAAPLEPGDRFWLAGWAHVGTRLQLAGPFWLEPRLMGGLSLVGWEFRVRVNGDPQPVHRQAGTPAGAALGLGTQFE